MAGWEDVPIFDTKAPPVSDTDMGKPIERKRPPMSVDAAPKEMPDLNRAIDFYKKRLGLTDEQASGAVKYMARNESGLNPTIVNPNSGALSIGQWLGPRKDALIAKYGRTPTLDEALEFSAQELETGADGGNTLKALKSAKSEKQAYDIWGTNFERPGGQALAAAGVGGGGWNAAPVVGAGNWNVSPKAIEYEMGRSNTSVRYMSPDEYLSLVPPLEDDGDNRQKSRSLAKSLALGDDIEAIPTLDVKRDKDKLKVFDQDGRNRALAAKEAGVDLIPVAIRGEGAIRGAIGEDREIVGMTGKTMPYKFADVPSVSRGTSALDSAMKTMGGPGQQASVGDRVAAQPQTGMGRYLATSAEALGQGASEIPGAIREAVTGVLGLGERAELGEQAAATGQPQAPAVPLEGLNRLADLGMFASGGLMGPIAPELQAARAAMTAPRPGGAPLAQAPAASIAPPSTNMLSGIGRERALLAREAMQDFKLPITAADIGGNPTVKAMTSAVDQLPLSGAGPARLEKQQSFNRAVSKTMGEDVPEITQTAMARARKRIGGVMNRIENENDVNLNNRRFLERLEAVENEAYPTLDRQERTIVKGLVNKIFDNVQAGDKIEGVTYGNLMHKGAALDRAANNSNPNVSRVAVEIQEAMRDALQDSLSGVDLRDYRQARFEYKNMKTIQRALRGSPTGDVSPAKLNAAVDQQFKNRAFDATGNNPLDRLGKIGQAFLKEAPSSGTAERSLAINALRDFGGAIKTAGMAGAGAAVIGLPMALAGTAASLGLGRFGGNMLRSSALAERAIQRALAPPKAPRANALIDFVNQQRQNQGPLP